MSYRETEHLRVLIANERKDRLLVAGRIACPRAATRAERVAGGSGGHPDAPRPGRACSNRGGQAGACRRRTPATPDPQTSFLTFTRRRRLPAFEDPPDMRSYDLLVGLVATSSSVPLTNQPPSRPIASTR